MENEEKHLLNKDLESTTDVAGLEKLKEDAELLGHEDIVAKAQEKIHALNTQVEDIMEQVDAKAERVESTGGSMTELEAKVGPIQEEVREVQKETGEQIAVVEDQEMKANIEDATYIEKTIENLETIKQSHHFAELLESAKKIEVYNEKYANQSAENPIDQFFLEDTKKENRIFENLLKKIFGDNRNGGRKIDDPKTIIDIDRAIENWKKDIPEQSQQVSEKKIQKEQSVESVGEKLNITIENAKKGWDAYIQSGELEKSDEFKAAETAIANLSKGQLGQDDGLNSWRVVTTKMDKFKDLILQKSHEFAKPVKDLQYQLERDMAGLDASDGNLKSLETEYAQAEGFHLDTSIELSQKLLKLYKEKVKILKV